MSNLSSWGGSASTYSTFAGFSDQPVKVVKRAKTPAAAVPDVVNAVYGYIRAVRTLGRKSVNTVDISRALGIAERDVERAVSALKDKGVKILG